MALSLDDRILGEKTHYYCSSSEDEDDDRGETKGTAQDKPPGSVLEPALNQYSGSCTNVNDIPCI